MPQVCIYFGETGVTAESEGPAALAEFVTVISKDLGLPRDWRNSVYAVGYSWDQRISTNCTIQLYSLLWVKVHYQGRKLKIRCIPGTTVQQALTISASQVRLPHGWSSRVIIEQGLTLETELHEDRDVFVKPA